MRYLTTGESTEPQRLPIFRHKLLMLGFVVFVVAAGMFATFLITPKYEATMSLLVTRGRIDPQVTASDKSAEITQSTISDEEFNSELELLKSVEVVRGAAKEIDLVNDQKPSMASRYAETRADLKSKIYGLMSDRPAVTPNVASSDAGYDFELEKVASRVIDNLSAVPVKNSRVIKVTYTDTDPIRAKKTLEAIYRNFVALHVELNGRPKAMQVFNDQSDKFSEQLNSSTQDLKSFDSKNGVVGADISTQQQLLQKQLSDIQTQADAARTEIGETIQKIAVLKEKIEQEPRQIQTGSVSRYVGAADKLKDELLQLEQQRTQLLQKYQPNSKFVRDNQERLEQVKRSLAAELANPPQEKTYALNDLRRRLESELADAQTKLAALKERERSLSTQVAKLTAEVGFLNSKSIERTGLERKRNINEEAYLLYEKKARENEINQALNKEQILNFDVVDAPRTDGEQKNPKPLLNLLVLIGVGSMAAFAAAIGYDRLTAVDPDNRLIRTAAEIERHFDLPVLASISHHEIDGNRTGESWRRIRSLPPASVIAEEGQ